MANEKSNAKREDDQKEKLMRKLCDSRLDCASALSKEFDSILFFYTTVRRPLSRLSTSTTAAITSNK
jgi:hypothetical protein